MDKQDIIIIMATGVACGLILGTLPWITFILIAM